ncbi:PA3611 family quorum-sensing-regulated virulence factor [Pseudomonas sp. EA_15y_Pfl1_P104]|uniref:PA3611 family quorum-sensing-regulated virulence factor n=1 Tax=Pseudomonas sp. EA_15y_Pfl1_P104 TaxID=3088686 RepID=UPI0030D9CC93
MLRSMLRLVAPSVALALVLPVCAQAASLLEAQMNRKLQSVAAESNKDLPREIDEKTLEVAYTVEGMQLIDHLSVMSDRAEQMRANPKAVYFQLGQSVCLNKGYRELMAKGAVMRYEITENKTNRPVASVKFVEADCPAPAATKKKK